jgi:hypothetical protein
VEEPAPTGKSAAPLPELHQNPFEITDHESPSADPG